MQQVHEVAGAPADRCLRWQTHQVTDAAGASGRRRISCVPAEAHGALPAVSERAAQGMTLRRAMGVGAVSPGRCHLQTAAKGGDSTVVATTGCARIGCEARCIGCQARCSLLLQMNQHQAARPHLRHSRTVPALPGTSDRAGASVDATPSHVRPVTATLLTSWYLGWPRPDFSGGRALQLVSRVAVP